MEYEIVKVEEKYIAGQSLVTDNAENRFGEVWASFLQANPQPQKVYAVYSGYESDFRGKFSFTVGAEGTNGVRIPAGHYIRIRGKRDDILSIWKEIWAGDIARAYGTDFEEYEGDSVSVYLSADLDVSPCGIDCRTCHDYETCGGCRVIGGKPSWLSYFGKAVCPEYDCPVRVKGAWDCGACKDLPCKTYYDQKDPSMTDEEHLANLRERVKTVKSRRGL